MSALKYLPVISSLNQPAPERPAKGNDNHFKRLLTPPRSFYGRFGVSAKACVCNKAGPAVQESHCCHSIALERVAACLESTHRA